MRLLSIVVPVFNEEANVQPLYDAVNRALAPLAERYTWEFVFTDNCSTDGTFQRLEGLAARDVRVRVFRFTRNFGFQRSILTGYRLARGDAAVQIDCDLQDPPEVILDFVRLWETGYKIVYGIRQSRPEPLHIHATRRLFYRLIAWLSSDDLPLDAGDFRLVDRCVLDLLKTYRNENPYIRGYIASLGYRQLGVSYDRSKRVRGKSSFGFRGLLNLALDGIVSHSILPLRIASLVGVSLSALATLGVVVYLALWLTYKSEWPAGFATVALLILVSLAANAVFFGIIGEYLARIYRQVNPQPLTIVERFIDRSESPDDRSSQPSARAVAGVIIPLKNSEVHAGARNADDGV